MTDQVLETVEIEPKQAATAAVIWLHGLGADGNDFAPIIPALNLPDELAIRFVFPHAPIQPVTLNGGMAMRSWYDIKSLSIADREDEAGVRASEQEVIKLIKRENARGIPSDRIVLAGFSQGGAVVLHTGTRYYEKLAGIMALSTYLPVRDALPVEKNSTNQNIPIFMAHGSMDPVVVPQLGNISRDLLETEGYSVEFHSYPMQHEVNYDEVQDIRAWLIKTLK